MKEFISILMILALAVTTAMVSSVSHAMPHHSVKSVETQHSQGEDCHHHKETKAVAGKTAQNKDGSGECCDKGMCKCIGGTCHNGLSKIFYNGGVPVFALNASKNEFNFSDEFFDSALPERLKRPPRA